MMSTMRTMLTIQMLRRIASPLPRRALPCVVGLLLIGQFLVAGAARAESQAASGDELPIPADKSAIVMNFENVLTNLNKQPPWGDVDQGTEPVRMTVLPSLAPRPVDVLAATDPAALSRLWAIKDADQQAFVGGGKPPGFAATLPAKPVHGDFRNALFYDFHAGRLDLLDNPKN